MSVVESHDDTLPPHPFVLITDDNTQARLLMRRIFEREGFQVDEASDGQTAIDKTLANPPDLILMDIQMPGLDGFEVVRILREDARSARVPIIVVTAAAREPSDVMHGFGLGADDYLIKPFNTTELLARAVSKIRARRLEDKLQQRTEELETLVQVGGEMNRALALDTVADSLLAAILDYLPTDYAFLVLLDDDQKPILDRRRGVDSPTEALLTPAMLPGYVLHTGEALLIDDTETDAPLAAIFEGTGCRSGVAAPFMHLSKMLGVLALGAPQPGYFSERHLRVLRSIGEQAALAIRNAHLYTQLQAYAHNLESMVETRTAALQAAQVQLMRAERLAALGTLAAGIAHEINNPLQPLLTNLELAIEDLDAHQPVDRELLDFAKQDVQRIKRIVSRLLDFARPAHLELLPTDINEIVEEVFQLAGKQLEHAHVKVNLQLGSVHIIMGSADQLKQVFLNLTVNAMDAMPDGGQLTIETDETGGFVRLIVTDTGVGIAPDQLERIFDPFFTTKPYGSGLGLSVSYSIIESHGGRITVDSEVDQYTRFTVYLPVAPQP